jgi:hypothetical protein
MGVRQHNTAKVGILREVAAVRGGGLLIEIGDTGSTGFNQVGLEVLAA